MADGLAGDMVRRLGWAGRRAGPPVRAVLGRFRHLSPSRPSFFSAYDSYAQALAAIPPRCLSGYDHEAVAEVSFEAMCRVQPWDYPVLFWLERLLPQVERLIDAGGHMGTKYRAFRGLLSLDDRVDWIVYDVPAIACEGRRRARQDGLDRLAFRERLEDCPHAQLLLASGLLQYLDIPFPHLLRRLPGLPDHLILNKVALREGRTIVTLENIGEAKVPYQIRNRAAFLSEIEELGYVVVDSWANPSLSHRILSRPELGESQSMGFCLRRARP